MKIGDRVAATDPVTGKAESREVVRTLVHSDEGDMTRLTVAGADGGSAGVDATSWHPVWVDEQGRFVDIGNLAPGEHLRSADGTHPVVTEVAH